MALDGHRIHVEAMRAVREQPDLPDVPAIAVCATCGDPACPGHDFELSGERPIRRQLPWEDGVTPAPTALWRTAIATASDLELWIRASTLGEGGVAPAFTFALACELVAVTATSVPITLVVSTLVWKLTHDPSLVRLVLELCGRVALVFVPMMIVIHVVHQWVIARVGGRRGRKTARAGVLRAGLYACGWDLATGPAGIIAPLFRGQWREATRRARGNSSLYRDATARWLHEVHGWTADSGELARRATWPWMVTLVAITMSLIAWAFAATLL